MIDRERIILMTRLAVFDKNHGDKDKKIDEYYQQDYIYRKNTITRIFTFCGCAVIILFYWVYRIFVSGVDYTELSLKNEIIMAAAFIIIVLTIYTSISTIHSIREYYAGKKRLERYYQLMNRLDQLKDRQRGN